MRFIYSLVILLVAHPALAEVSPQYYENARAQCRNESCCVASVDAMKKAGGVLPGANQSCFESWRLNTLKCASSLSWCEPNKELAAQLSTTPMTAADYEKAKTECAGTSCCLRSVESIYRGRHFVAGPGGLCPAGYRGEMLRCHDSLRWCVKSP